jgi:hypothetical protein
MDLSHLARNSRLKEVYKEEEEREENVFCYWICLKKQEGTGN